MQDVSFALNVHMLEKIYFKYFLITGYYNYCIKISRLIRLTLPANALWCLLLRVVSWMQLVCSYNVIGQRIGTNGHHGMRRYNSHWWWHLVRGTRYVME